MIAFLNRRTASLSSSAVIGPCRINWSRMSDGTGASGVSGVRLFRLRRIGSPHAMPHTRNFGYPRFESRRPSQLPEKMDLSFRVLRLLAAGGRGGRSAQLSLSFNNQFNHLR